MGISVTEALNKLFGSIDKSFWPSYLLAVAGLGVLTMAILQALKNTTPVCRWFQRYQMLKFLKSHAAIAYSHLGERPDCTKAETQIVLLATDGDAHAFYELEIEKLCGQWNAAIQIALDSPKLYPDFFACVSARAEKSDYSKVKAQDYPVSVPPHLEAELSSDEQLRRLHHRQAFIDARTHVVHQIQRAVDSFQIATAYRWKWLLQVASFALSFGLAAFAMIRATNMDFSFFKAIIWAAIAGFLAPVARDLLAGIEKLRS
jgi:hypothetical protein